MNIFLNGPINRIQDTQHRLRQGQSLSLRQAMPQDKQLQISPEKKLCKKIVIGLFYQENIDFQGKTAFFVEMRANSPKITAQSLVQGYQFQIIIQYLFISSNRVYNSNISEQKTNYLNAQMTSYKKINTNLYNSVKFQKLDIVLYLNIKYLDPFVYIIFLNLHLQKIQKDQKSYNKSNSINKYSLKIMKRRIKQIDQNYLINLLMEALIIASRSVNQDKFFQKDQENKYEKHISQVTHIQNKRQNTILEWEEEVDGMSKSLRKAKSAAKNFRAKQDQVLIKKQNMKLLKKIWNLQPIVNTFNIDKFQYVSGSNWNQHRKKQQNIREENRKIMQRVVLLQKVEVHDYKKKLKEQIKDYMERRNSIRKVKITDKPRRSGSELKAESILKARKSSPVPQSPEIQQSKELPKLFPTTQEQLSALLSQN